MTTAESSGPAAGQRYVRRSSLATRLEESGVSAALTRHEVLLAGVFSLVLGFGILGLHVVDGAFYTDDWAFAAIRDAHSGLDLFRAFGSASGGRPALGIYLPAVFALFGLNAHLHLAWAAILTAALGFGVYLVLRMVNLPRLAAAAVAALLIVFPFSDAVKLWATASAIQWSLVIYVAGVVSALRGFGRVGTRAVALHSASLALYVISMLTYESTVGLIACTVGAYFVKTTPRAAIARWIVDIAALVATVEVVITRTAKTVHHSLGDQLHHAHLIFQQGVVLMGHVLSPWAIQVEGRRTLAVALFIVCGAAWLTFGRGALHVRAGQVALGAVSGTVIVAICAGRHVLAAVSVAIAGGVAWVVLGQDVERRNRVRQGLLLAVAGVVGIAAGYVAYIPTDDYYSPYGTEGLNRVNAAASIGYVMLTVGLVATLAAVLFRSATVQAAVIGLVMVALFAGYARTLVRDELLWDRAGQYERAAVAEISRAVPQPLRSGTVYVWDERTSLTPQLPVFNSTWDLPNAMGIAWGMKRSARVFPMLDTTVFRCGRARMFPTEGLYGPSYGTKYGDGIFVAPMLSRGALVGSQSQCRQLVTRLATPRVAYEGLPLTLTAGEPVHLAVTVALGRQPLDALSLHFQIGSRSQGVGCDPITLPSGLAQCWLTVPPALRGQQPLSVDFGGDASLRAAHLYRAVRVRPPPVSS